MSISAKHLEDLDEFDSLTDAGAKSLIMNLLSLVAADADPGTQKVYSYNLSYTLSLTYHFNSL